MARKDCSIFLKCERLSHVSKHSAVKHETYHPHLLERDPSQLSDLVSASHSPPKRLRYENGSVMTD